MLIKPFKPLNDIDKEQKTIKSIRTDIICIPDLYEPHYSRVVVSKKYLIKNFSLKDSVSFIKVVYVFLVDIKNNMEASDFINNIEDMKLEYITTSLYDTHENHFFGNLIYDFTGPTPVANSVFEFKQNVNTFIKDSYTQEEIVYANNNAMYAEIIKDTEDGMISFGLIVGTPKNYQLNNHQIRKNRKMAEFTNNANVTVTVYSNTMKSNFDTFSDDALLNRSQEINSMTLGSQTEELALLSTTKNELIVRKETIDRISSDLIKANMLTLIESVTIIYDRGKINIVNVKYPFDKILIPYVERVMMIYKNEILSVLNPAVELLGNMKCIISINDGFSVAKIKLYDDNNFNKINEFSTINYTDEMLNEYLFNNCKSKRYRRTHPSPKDYERSRIQYIMDWFIDEQDQIDIPF